MPANVETMFYTSNEENGRFTPWHGLGTEVKEAPTSADALRLAGLDWTVEQTPVFTDNGILIPGYKANRRSSDQSILGIVTDRYKIVQNEEAFSFTDSIIGDDVRYETAGSLSGGKRVWMLAKMPTTTILGDDVDPYLCFTNSHDGTGAIKVCMSPIRVVCQNTLNLALNTATRSWSTKHMGDMQSKLDEAKYTLGLAETYMGKLGEEAERLASMKIDFNTLNKIVEEMFPIKEDDSDRHKKTMQKARDEYFMCYFAPDLANYVNTAYGAINAMSDFATHSAPARLTKNYAENNFARTIDGHPMIDAMYERLCAVA